MIGKEGVCHDYFNQIHSIEMNCQLLLSSTPLNPQTEEEIRGELLEDLEKCISYSEYFEMVSKNPKAALAFKKFLTDKGKEDWKRLDEIVVEIKSITSLERSDLEKLTGLLEEAKSLLPD